MERGLSNEDYLKLRNTFGENALSVERRFTTQKLFLRQFPTLINGILALGALFSFAIHEPLDGIFILFIVLLSATLGFYQEFKAEKAIEKLKQFSQPRCVVIRNGKTFETESSQLVPGDIVILNEGDRIPADGFLKRATQIEIDESLVTGESLPVSKSIQEEVLMGTFVAKGKGVMEVVKIGKTTKLGQISTTLGTVTEEETPLQHQISGLTRILSLFALLMALLILPAGIAYGKDLYPLILLVISISVAAIPESLPVVITIALSLGTNRMAQKHAIVRRLSSIETIGAITVILTDKTGTITQNDMKVKDVWVPQKKFLHELIHACMIGNTAHITDQHGQPRIIGDKTDGALLLWATEQGNEYIDEPIEIIDEYTFNPKTKSITTIASYHKKTLVISRGAPESILNMCRISESEKESLTRRYQSYAAKGLRVIAAAQKGITKGKKFSRTEIEENLTFLGFLCLYDPPRKEAKQAVDDAHNSGIRVVMVTGDNPLTAESIAQDVGITQKSSHVVTGSEIDEMNDADLLQTIETTNLFARTTPEHKLRLVKAFQSAGHLVGVTGDGVNDALALKQANVGLAMGEKGTDVAREASDIVLQDDNFATIVSAVHEGRRIYANVVKAITYLVSGNLGELLLVMFATFGNTDMPLLPTQILWINLITDGLPALALANDPHDGVLKNSHPHAIRDHFLTSKRLIFVLTAGTFLASLCFFLFSQLDHVLGVSIARTVVFNFLIVMEIVLVFVVRGKQKIFSNMFLIGTAILTILLQCLLTFTPFLQEIFHLTL